MNTYKLDLGESIRTGAVTVVGLIPCVLLISVPHSALEQSVSPDALMMLAGCWIVIAAMIILAKGLPGVLATTTTVGAAWLIVGMMHLLAAIGLLVDCGQSRLPTPLSFHTASGLHERRKDAGVYPTRSVEQADDRERK